MVAALFMLGGLYLFVVNIGRIIAGCIGLYGIDGFIGTWGALFLVYLVLMAIF